MTSALGQALRPVVRLVDRLRGRSEDPLPPSRPTIRRSSHDAGDGPNGVLLVHGFTSTPQSMRPWAEHLEAAGFAVSLPRLPGHGTHWKELNQTAWTDWYAHADAAFAVLRARCDRVFIAGLSMGGALGLRLASSAAMTSPGWWSSTLRSTHRDIRMKILPVLHHLIPAAPAAIGNDVADPGGPGDRVRPHPLHALHSQTHLWADVRETTWTASRSPCSCSAPSRTTSSTRRRWRS